MFDKLAANKVFMFALNAVAGAALLISASWFSYNIFTSRDTSEKVLTHLQKEPAKAQ